MPSFFPRDVLDEILSLIESVSEDFPTYSLENLSFDFTVIINLDAFNWGTLHFSLCTKYFLLSKFYTELVDYLLLQADNPRCNPYPCICLHFSNVSRLIYTWYFLIILKVIITDLHKMLKIQQIFPKHLHVIFVR